MEVYSELSQLPEFTNTVVTIGSYDGLHLGHKKVFDKVKRLAKEVGGKSVLISFEPHPRIAMRSDLENFSLLTTREEKIEVLSREGLDYVVLIPFTKYFQEQLPHEYIKDYLVEKFHPRYIVVGFDHRFGKDRKGSITDLIKYSSVFNYEVIEIKKEEKAQIKISSTRIRDYIGKGKIIEANKLLGHPYHFTGTVIPGDMMGRQLGFPTANISIDSWYKMCPPIGIYAVKVKIDNSVYQGMLYIGKKPTLKKNNPVSVEVNIFEFSENIYGKTVSIYLLEYIRGDKKFKSKEILIENLNNDKIKTIEILNKYREVIV